MSRKSSSACNSAKSQKDKTLQVTFCDSKWSPDSITPYNVLQYFCNLENPFYDIESDNEFYKMQNNRGTGLKSMTGIQYKLWYSCMPLHIICKYYRTSSDTVKPLAYYNIINGVVYQAPDMYSLTQSRLLGCLEPLRNAFEQVTKSCQYSTVEGYYWEFKKTANAKYYARYARYTKTKRVSQKEEKEETLEPRSTSFQRERTLMVLNQLFEEYPINEAIEMDPEEEANVQEHRANSPRFAVPTLSKKAASSK
ncbi:hypothetical protein L5515_008438 [Caenorhabditis briggsae]|nr:hypothetical protein L5515_008438 [Caenorhabditis briggsae]